MRLEEWAAATEQDRHLMEDYLVDEARLQRLGHDAAAHQADVLVAGGFAGRRTRAFSTAVPTTGDRGTSTT